MDAVDRFRLDGAVAVVTGAGGGIGRAGSVAFAQAGADIAVVGRNRSKLEETARAGEQTGRHTLICEADGTNEASVGHAREQILRAFGKVDILFNNAGITSPKILTDLAPDKWPRIIYMNLTCAYLCARAFAPGMIARRHGRIIQMGSILSGRGMAT